MVGFSLFRGLQPADSCIQYLYTIYMNTPLLHTFNNNSLQLLVTMPSGIPWTYVRWHNARLK